MRLEGEGAEGSANSRSLFTRHGKQGLMPAMNAIEIADGDDTLAHRARYRIIAANDLQSQ